MDPCLAAAVRHELHTFVRGAGRRRTLEPTCHVGRPGEDSVPLPHPFVDWPSLRADLVERALDGLADPTGACAWVTRSGTLERSDADVAWLAAALSAFARHGLVLPAFFVINRTGWVELLGGESRVWRRVRHGSPASG